MKTYVKPTVDVVKLSVKENMAALPAGVQGVTGTYSYTVDGATTDVPLTTYNLTAVTTSENV